MSFDGFTAGVLLQALGAGGCTVEASDEMASLYKELKKSHDAPSQETREQVLAMIGKPCRIKYTGYLGEVVGLNDSSAGFYPGGREPVYVKITRNVSKMRSDVVGKVFSYGLDQIILLDPAEPTYSHKGFSNLVGDHSYTDDRLRFELELAGIQTIHEEDGLDPKRHAELLRNTSGEVKTSVIGSCYGWIFKRLSTYWSAYGPGLSLPVAAALYNSYGTECRVGGSGACPTPLEAYHGLGTWLYHVDTPSGLKALSAAILAEVKAGKQAPQMKTIEELTAERAAREAVLD